MTTDPQISLQDSDFEEALRRIRAAAHDASTEVDLSSLGLTECPAELTSLRQLRELDLSFNELAALPPAIHELRHLTKLSLADNNLARLPDNLCACSALTFLDIHGNRLAALPAQFGCLSNLRDLNAASNEFDVLPASFASLTRLRHIDLSLNRLCEIDTLQCSLELQTLYVLGNRLTTVPLWLDQLTQLRRLSFADNQLLALPESLGRLTALTALYVNNNQLGSLPDTIGDLVGLTDLYLNGNHLTTLPDSLGRLVQLRSLHVDHNALVSLPDSIGTLLNIQELFVQGNRLSALPSSIGKLTTLRVLDVSFNQLNALPLELRTIQGSLDAIHLYHNPCMEFPSIGDTTATTPPIRPCELLEYYFKTRGGARPVMEAKLILVGRGGVGKTSLVNRLVDGTFDPDEPVTDVIDVTDWNIILNEHETARLHVWDFGGQEILHATHQFFLTHRSIYLLVLSGRESNEDRDAQYWLNLITSLAPDSPVIVVLNKCKQYPVELNRRGTRQNFPRITAVVVTDCADGTGIADLHAAIRDATDGLEHLRDQLPEAWFKIKERLASMPENYLTYAEYQKICAEYGEASADGQDALASWLHWLGIALNYKDDYRLQDTHVLNRRWVTEGIYRILTAHPLREQGGELIVDDLRYILDSRDYPGAARAFLIDLMRKFELCVRLPDEGRDRYLVPELLGKEEPAALSELAISEGLGFEYHYPLLPEGMVARFIARTYIISRGQPRWRTGVVLQWDGNGALVRADALENKVRILVTGFPAGRRRLLAVIRSHFEQIHRSYSFEVQPMVPDPRHPGFLMPYNKLVAFERAGKSKVDEVFGEEVIEVNVRELLDGVDLGTARRGDADFTHPPGPLRIFYSYSHKDDELRAELENHLIIFKYQGLIQDWHDRLISPGKEWEGEIDINLERADVILLLVSSDFNASRYCYCREMRRALERHNNAEARVIPIILRDCNWSKTPFAKIQALPRDGIPVMLWPHRDSGWRNVADGIGTVLNELRGV